MLVAILALSAVTFPTTLARADDAPEVVHVRSDATGGFTSRATLESSPREITDAASLLEPMPGVHVRRMGGEDSFATISIRGSSSNQVTVFVAGVPLTGGADPTLDLATLPLWPHTRARVFRSFTPPTLGAGSLGGSLAIDPPPPAPSGASTEVYGAMGSFGAARLRVGDRRENVATAVSATRSDDDFTYLDPVASSSGTDVFRTRANAGHAAANGIVTYVLPVPVGAGADGSLRTTAMLQARDQELPGTVKAPTLSQKARSDRELLALEWAVPLRQGGLRVRAWGRRQGFAVMQSRAEALRNLGPERSSDAVVAAGTSLALRGTPARTFEVEGRIEAGGERYAPGTWSLGTAPAGAERKSMALAADTTWRPRITSARGHVPGLAFAVGGRVDGHADTSESPAASDATLLLPTFRAGADVDFGSVSLSAHGGHLARAPSFVERFGNRGAFVGEPSLAPESARTFDVGAKGARTFGPLRMEAEAVFFTTDATDLIVFVNVGAYGRAKATNIGRASLTGAEVSVDLRAHGIDLHASYTGLATANGAACDARVSGRCVSPNLPGRPEHDVVVDLSFTRGPVRVRYGIDALSGMTADLAGTVTVPPRVLHGAGATVEVPFVPGLRLGFDVKNLFDLRTADYAGVLGPVRVPVGDVYEYPLPGRRFLVHARFEREVPPKGAGAEGD
ncbi:MAG: TonB-dependent receptor [Polyangiaceae bacterium]